MSIQQLYKNKTKIIPSVEEVISSLCYYNVDFILIGSEVGKIYGLCEFTKDIDLLINPSTSNFQKLHIYLKQHFDVHFESLLTMDRIVLLSKEKKIELFIYDALFVEYDFNNRSGATQKAFNNTITILSEKEYISCVKKCIIYHTSKENWKQVSKYTNTLNKYNTKYSI